MMLWSEALAVVPVTVHIPLKDVPSALTTDLIVRTGRIVARDLKSRFGMSRPRLALAGLNPHAGERATLGTEERDVIAPAIAELQAEGLAVTGPLPADTLFHAAARGAYDAALAMYHDQALVPIKTIAFDEAVNVTLGLPFVRTSPDHGTAFDIAGQGIARPTASSPPCNSPPGSPPDEPHRRPASLAGGRARHGLVAKKSLGQNFLFDLNLTAASRAAAGRSTASPSSRSARVRAA